MKKDDMLIEGAEIPGVQKASYIIPFNCAVTRSSSNSHLHRRTRYPILNRYLNRDRLFLFLHLYIINVVLALIT